MENISNSIIALFVATTIASVWQFYRASKSKKALAFILAWALLISILGITGFYNNFTTTPPRMAFMFIPVFLVSVVFPFTPYGRKFIETLDISKLTLLHVVRIPVEITLYYVALSRLIPESMTFAGYNFDILSGLTAPVVYFMVHLSQSFGKRFLLIWNFACLALLANVLTIAVLAVPSPFQQWAFDQPNIGVASFPLVWLPGIIVPIVLFSHMAAIIRLTKAESMVPAY